jgi:hypothetical protein
MSDDTGNDDRNDTRPTTDERTNSHTPDARAQTELPALAVALVLLTTVLLFGLGMADGALSSAETQAVERQAAVGLSDQLTAASAPVAIRPNVLDPDALSALERGDLESTYGLSPEHEVSVTLDGERLAGTDTLSEGTQIDRLVLIERRSERTLVPDFDADRSVTLPRRTPNATLEIDPPPAVVVRSVRANDRVLLWNESGLRGEFTVSLSRLETKRLAFETAGVLSRGDVEITYYPAETRKATLSVIVDA